MSEELASSDISRRYHDVSAMVRSCVDTDMKMRLITDENLSERDINENECIKKGFIELIPKEKIISNRRVRKTNGKNDNSGKKKDIHIKSKLSDLDKEEIERFALDTINKRIDFCKKYKTNDDDIGKCVCESLRRYVRISEDVRTKKITKIHVGKIKKLFEDMKKEGKIKCNESV